jgi:TolA-binding protein
MLRITLPLIGSLVLCGAAQAAPARSVTIAAAARTVADDAATTGASLTERVSALERQERELSGRVDELEGLRVGRSKTDSKSVHGQLRYRTQWESRVNDLSHRLDFDLGFVKEVADGVKLKLQLGTGIDNQRDIIAERHGRKDTVLEQAYVEAHLGEDD